MFSRSVRASSPRLNVIVLTGYVLLQPTALFSGLVLSANELLNPSPTLLTTFCQVSELVDTKSLAMSV